MKKIVIGLSAAALLFSGCETKTGTGALVGGIVGAGVGAGIGAAVSGGSGVAVGAGAGAAGGALIGGVIGDSLDREDRQKLERHTPRTLRKIDNGERLSLYDIKQMTHSGVDDKAIIAQIEATRSHYNLTSADIIDLKNAKVSQNVIDVMLGY